MSRPPVAVVPAIVATSGDVRLWTRDRPSASVASVDERSWC